MIPDIHKLFPDIVQKLIAEKFHRFDIFDLDDFESNESNKGYSFVTQDTSEVRKYLEELDFKLVKSTTELFDECYCLVYNRFSKNGFVRIHLTKNFKEVTRTLAYLVEQKANIKTSFDRYTVFKQTLDLFLNKD